MDAEIVVMPPLSLTRFEMPISDLVVFQPVNGNLGWMNPSIGHLAYSTGSVGVS